MAPICAKRERVEGFRSRASRALFPSGVATPAELYELELAASGAEWSPPRPPGTWENLVVAAGRIEVELSGDVHPLDTGDSILFPADVPHVYRNREPVPARMYMVMTHRSP